MPIALYDLDGTLLPWDCQLLFRRHVCAREPWRAMLILPFLALLPFAGILGSDGMKRVFLAFLWRMPPDTLARHSKEFADSLTSHFYPELLATLDAHKKSGHLTILASASPECYVSEIGRNLGFNHSLGTHFDPGPLFPDLTNHKGTAKPDRLRELLPISYFQDGILRDSHGYTDSAADLPMLAICTTATVVNPSPTLTAIADKKHWTIVRPSRPWRTPLEKARFIIKFLFTPPPSHCNSTDL